MLSVRGTFGPNSDLQVVQGNYMRQYMELEPELRLLYAQNAESR